ncbi:hypothetical protein Psi01_81320 [Planobispora siamensis]|uniref:DUF4189 domain-containing protein n=2 Tax=Planobispora siamensis TaxID=936338 RepID=A0A8J3WQZ3_9ACTN|nr:hypothetical protein Psi01_81320 [Planobispora siamensis]
MVRRILLALTSLISAGAAVTVPSASATAAKEHGAIAFSPSKGIFVGTLDDTASGAVTKAAKQCHKWARSGDCQTVIRFSNGYGALATPGGSNVGYGSGWGSTQADADAEAVRVCTEDGNSGCYVVKRLAAGSPSDAAEGAGLGRVCFFRALPTQTPLHGIIGHIGWAYRDNNRAANPWTIGATEQLEGNPEEPGNAEVESWTAANLSWKQVLKKFRTGGHFADKIRKLLNGKQYYQAYRCLDTLSASPQAAKNKYEDLKKGYHLLTDNCLTKAVAILRAYGADLPSARAGLTQISSTPNYYFNTKISKYGFLPSTPL